MALKNYISTLNLHCNKVDEMPPKTYEYILVPKLWYGVLETIKIVIYILKRNTERLPKYFKHGITQLTHQKNR